jgi:DNA ligase-1
MSCNYFTLASFLHRISQTSKTNEKIACLSKYFSLFDKKDVDAHVAAVYLMQNKVAPDYENVILGVGNALLIKAIAQAYDTTPTKIESLYKLHGDLGIAASSMIVNDNLCDYDNLCDKSVNSLSLSHILDTLKSIPKITGKDSQSKKIDVIASLIRGCSTKKEVNFLLKMLSGKLRIGVGENTIIAALALAHTQTSSANETKARSEKFKEIYNSCPDFNIFFSTILNAKDFDNVQINPSPGIPINPMSVSLLLKKYQSQCHVTCHVTLAQGFKKILSIKY